MLLGMGPHILHDLPLAIYRVVPEKDLDRFQEDPEVGVNFDEHNCSMTLPEILLWK